jgi:hypothetical protein
MKLLLLFILAGTFSFANAQTKTTILANFNPAGLGLDVISLTIPADLQTKSSKITYVKNEYGNGRYSIIGFGADDKLSYASTNKLGVTRDIIVVYNNYTKDGGRSSLIAEENCSWCACVKACAVACQTNWCNIACLLGCIEY